MLLTFVVSVFGFSDYSSKTASGDFFGAGEYASENSAAKTHDDSVETFYAYEIASGYLVATNRVTRTLEDLPGNAWRDCFPAEIVVVMADGSEKPGLKRDRVGRRIESNAEHLRLID